MSRQPIPTEEFREIEPHLSALHHSNRVRKTQTLGKRSRAERRFAGVPKCPLCHAPLPLCRCD